MIVFVVSQKKNARNFILERKKCLFNVKKNDKKGKNCM